MCEKWKQSGKKGGENYSYIIGENQSLVKAAHFNNVLSFQLKCKILLFVYEHMLFKPLKF